MRSWFLAKGIAILLMAIVPSYSFERLTEYAFLTGSPYFFTLSGLRIETFILSILLLAVFSGSLADELRFSLVPFVMGVIVLLILFFYACNPRVCYSTGIDGLEPLRMGLFFSSLVVVGLGFGNTLRTGNLLKGRHAFALGVMSFIAIAYYPVIFTLGGTRLLAPLDPIPLVVFVALLSFGIASATRQTAEWKLGLGAPLPGLGSLLLVGIGITGQYFLLVIPEVIILVGASVLGAVAGSFPFNSRFPATLRSPTFARRLLAGLVIFVLAMVVLVLPDAVVGLTPMASGSARIGALVMGSSVYVGGAMTDAFVRSKAVSVTLSFTGTNSSAIQADNFLAAGIGIHSPNCCVDGIDYGYRFDVYLFHDGTRWLVANAWAVCDFNAACGGHSWKYLMFSNSTQLTSGSLSSLIRLIIEWNGRLVSWDYSVDGGQPINFTHFRAPDQENGYFNAGAASVFLGNPQQSTTFFYQFDFMSRYSINRPGWIITFVCPSYIQNSIWVCIRHANSVQGDQSYWKALWRWGENYDGVTARSDPNAFSVNFSQSQSTLTDFQVFW